MTTCFYLVFGPNDKTTDGIKLFNRYVTFPAQSIDDAVKKANRYWPRLWKGIYDSMQAAGVNKFALRPIDLKHEAKARLTPITSYAPAGENKP